MLTADRLLALAAAEWHWLVAAFLIGLAAGWLASDRRLGVPLEDRQ